MRQGKKKKKTKTKPANNFLKAFPNNTIHYNRWMISQEIKRYQKSGKYVISAEITGNKTNICIWSSGGKWWWSVPLKYMSIHCPTSILGMTVDYIRGTHKKAAVKKIDLSHHWLDKFITGRQIQVQFKSWIVSFSSTHQTEGSSFICNLYLKNANVSESWTSVTQVR